MKNYAWKEYFASAGETRRYLEDVCAEHDILGNFVFNKDVTGAVWNEQKAVWEVGTTSREDGQTETIEANFLWSAVGLFATPSIPDIKGLKDYKGAAFHSADWDHSVSLGGKRVALIGTGSTGTQMTPGLGKMAKQLAVFQRTPNWISGFSPSFSLSGSYRFRQCPWATIATPSARLRAFSSTACPSTGTGKYLQPWRCRADMTRSRYCYAAHVAAQQLQWMQTYDREWIKNGGRINERNDKARENLVAYIKQKTEATPGLFEKVLPKHSPLVRRLVVDNSHEGKGFYDTIQMPHVELVTERIDHFDEKGIVTADGKRREFDVVVLAGGFKTSHYFHPAKYVGRGGATFAEEWKKDGARSYLGLTNPGFPNFASFYGVGRTQAFD
jgi:4-hydroxyacetophenone monooxygenase